MACLLLLEIALNGIDVGTDALFPCRLPPFHPRTRAQNLECPFKVLAPPGCPLLIIKTLGRARQPDTLQVIDVVLPAITRLVDVWETGISGSRSQTDVIVWGRAGRAGAIGGFGEFGDDLFELFRCHVLVPSPISLLYSREE